jgi:hypothetical protein
VSVFVSVKLKSGLLSFLSVIETGKIESAALTFIKASVQLTSSSFNLTALVGSSFGGGGSVVLQEKIKREIKTDKETNSNLIPIP